MSSTLGILAHSILSPLQEPDWVAMVPAANKRRDPRIWQMAHVAVARLLTSQVKKPKSIITATALGALDETRSFLEGVFTKDFGSPRNFISSVHNSMGGKISLDFAISGENLTFCDGPNSLASAIIAASILPPSAFPVLIVAIDESFTLLQDLIPHLGQSCNSWLNPHWQECAFALLLDLCPHKNSGTKTISAKGPFPVSPVSIQSDIAQAITLSYGAHNYNPTVTNNPAIELNALLNTTQASQTFICTHSPSAQASAIISVCV